MSDPLIESRPSSGPDPAARPARPARRSIDFALRLLFLTAFAGGIYFSARLGVHMAKNRIPGNEIVGAAVSTPDGVDLTLGSPGEPVYLAETPEELRRFFATYASAGERASADLNDFSIRRINAYLLATAKRAEADAVEVEIKSGTIAGAVYWVHHTQVPDRTAIDPVISPIPPASPPP